MSPEDMEMFAKWIMYNNRLLSAIIIRLYGDDSDYVMDQCLKDVERAIKISKKKNNKKTRR